MRLRNGGTANIDAAEKVRVEWATAKNDDEQHIEEGISEFSVEILDSDGNFMEFTDCKLIKNDDNADFFNGEVNPHCFIEMKEFWDGDFKMDQGTYITVRVTAKNVKGDSLPSQWNIDGAIV